MYCSGEGFSPTPTGPNFKMTLYPSSLLQLHELAVKYEVYQGQTKLNRWFWTPAFFWVAYLGSGRSYHFPAILAVLWYSRHCMPVVSHCALMASASHHGKNRTRYYLLPKSSSLAPCPGRSSSFLIERNWFWLLMLHAIGSWPLYRMSYSGICQCWVAP